MKLFSNMRMGQKLISCFTLIALLIGAVGFLGINNMRKINSNAMALHNDNLMSIEELMQIRQNLSDIQINFLKLIFTEDSSNGQFEKQVSQKKDSNVQLMKEFEKKQLSKEEQDLYVQLKGLMDKYIE